MEKKQSFAEKLRLYDELKAKCDEFERSKAGKAGEIGARFEALAREIREFCTSSGFLSIMQVLSRINAGKLLFSPTERKVSYMGRVPRPLSFNETTCFTVKDEAKKMMLSVKSGNPKDEAVIARLCVGYVTLVSIADSAESLCLSAKAAASRETDREIEEARARIDELHREIHFGHSTDTGDRHGIFVGSKSAFSNREELLGLAEKHGINPELLEERIFLSPDSDVGSVFIAATDAERDGIELHRFINGIFYRNFLKYRVGELQIACIENTKQSTLPLFELNNSLLSHDEYEANLTPFSYGAPAGDEDAAADMLDRLCRELTERKAAFGPSSSYSSILDFNEKNKYNKRPEILLILNGYPGVITSEDSFRSLTTLMKDGGKYGIYVVAIGSNTPLNLTYGTEYRLDFYSLGARELRLSDPTVNLVDIGDSEVRELRLGAAGDLKQTEVLYLDELLENRLSISDFAKEITIPIGLSDGKVYYFATSVDGSKTKYHSSPSTLIVGATGKGKSAFLHTLMLSGAYCYSPDELQFYIVDFKSKEDSAEFAPYLYREGVENLYIPHVRYLSMKSKPENVYDVINMINSLIDRRGALFSSVGAKDFVAYNSNPEIKERVARGELPRVPQIYFLIDEYMTMLGGGVDGDGSAKTDIETRLLSILTRIRTSGVGLIFAGQKCVFNTGTMGQIGNRIAFDTGDAKLLNPMFSFSFIGGDDNTALYSRIGGKIGYAASVRSVSETRKEVVRTAFSGSHMGERQLALAKKIREKYPDPRCYGRQIVPGDDVMELADSFLSEECAAPVSREELIRMSEDGELAIPLYVGVSSMTSNPIAASFYLQKGHGGLVLAKESKQGKVEANLALSFLRYLAVNGTKEAETPRVILCENASREFMTDPFGNRIRVGSALTHPLIRSLEENSLSRLVDHKVSALDTAEAILEAEKMRHERFSGKSHDLSPYMLILHNADWLLSLESYIESELETERMENESEPAPAPAVSGLGGFTLAPELLAQIKNADVLASVTAGLNGPLPTEKPRKKQRDGKITAPEVMRALSSLMRDGNSQNVLVLISTTSKELIEKATGVRTGTRSELESYGPIIYDSADTRKTLKVDPNANKDTCFVLPAELKARLYDTSSAARGWWEEMKRLYK